MRKSKLLNVLDKLKGIKRTRDNKGETHARQGQIATMVNKIVQKIVVIFKVKNTVVQKTEPNNQGSQNVALNQKPNKNRLLTQFLKLTLRHVQQPRKPNKMQNTHAPARNVSVKRKKKRNILKNRKKLSLKNL